MNDEEGGLVPVNIKIPEDLLVRFDEFWPGKFASRSEAIREGMTDLLDGVRKSNSKPNARKVATAVGVPPQ